MNKAEYIQNVHSYDREQLKEYVKVKEEVKERKAELEAGQADMEQMSADMGRQQTELQGTLDSMKSQIADFDTQLEAARAEARHSLLSLRRQQKIWWPLQKDRIHQEVRHPAAEIMAAPASFRWERRRWRHQQASTGGGNNKPSGGGSTSTPGNASLGQQIASRACQYVGNPYKYGGTSLTNGADCSGFVMSVHALFGISTPRDSWGQLAGGKAVNYSDMLPGDVIVYSNHVAIYIGGNQIVHASNSAPYPAGGIKISSPPNYRTVLGVRRYW